MNALELQLSQYCVARNLQFSNDPKHGYIARSTVHLSMIRQGDTVEHNGHLCTVSGKDIPKRGFLGYSIFGDASKQYITKVNFVVSTMNGIVLR